MLVLLETAAQHQEVFYVGDAGQLMEQGADGSVVSGAYGLDDALYQMRDGCRAGRGRIDAARPAVRWQGLWKAAGGPGAAVGGVAVLPSSPAAHSFL
ncbi:hypothetical protein [Streptomyces griseus]|uniref:hypothetical protein n=1 Tax=Streptomyces griseus TaxID=1911 RepID=UPI003702AEDA